MYFVTLRGEAAYYVRRAAFIVWIILGFAMLFANDTAARVWGALFIVMGIIGIKKFGLRRYPHASR